MISMVQDWQSDSLGGDAGDDLSGSSVWDAPDNAFFHRVEYVSKSRLLGVVGIKDGVLK